MTRSVTALSALPTETPGPQRPPLSRFRISAAEDSLVLQARPGLLAKIFVGRFISLWLSFWTGGVFMLLSQLWNHFEWFLLLFAIPFVVIEIGALLFLIGILFHSERLELTPDSVLYRSWAIIPLRRRSVPTQEVVQAVFSQTRSGKNTKSLLQIETVGEPFNIASGVTRTDAEYAASSINRWLQQHVPQRQRVPSPEQQREVAAETDHSLTAQLERLVAGDDSDRGEVLVPDTGPELPPTDSRWVATHEFDGVEFRRRGRWSLGAILMATCFMLFWNGIVSTVAFGALRDDDLDWGLVLFLIPFVAVGAVLLLVWLGALLAPLQITTWTFDRYEIVRRSQLLLFSRTKRYPVESVSHLELDTPTFDKDEVTTWRELSVIDSENNTVATITRLTENEARWMAREIYHACYHWFR